MAEEIPREIIERVNEIVYKYNQISTENTNILRLGYSDVHILCDSRPTLFFIYESGKYCDALEDVLTDIDLEIARKFGRSEIGVQSYPFGVERALKEGFKFFHNYEAS
ncbi:MAG: hypothetical protein KKF50_01740 [Nanoarchaeota archaeon]|nr:hypothetical protein [Nanoarchaeota archaeon]